MAKSESSKRFHLEGIDRISSLPETLLSRILSLLPTKYAVATSILSIRWKFLWTSVTNLSFDDQEFRRIDRRGPKQSLEMKKSFDMRKFKFTQFVNRVLLLLNPPCIQNFQLKCHHQSCDPFYIDSWICAAMGRTVQKLELHLVMDQYVKLPLSHFHCKTLAALKLNGKIHFNIAEATSISFPNMHTLHLSKIEFTVASNCSVSFPSLKDLLLDYVKDTNEESVHKLIASCTVLDSLVIKRRDWDDPNCLIISVHSLRNLSIHVNWGDGDWPPEKNKFLIDTPALKYLDVEDISLCWFTSENLSSLLEARIDMEFHGSLTIDDNSYTTSIIKFIAGLFNVKFLSISGVTLEVFSFIPANIAPPVFCNLTQLELSKYNCSDWSVVLKFLLANMNSLEHLVSKGYRYVCSDNHKSASSWWTEPLCVPMCLLHRVTTISFAENICGCNDELELIRYFLNNAKVLKMFSVKKIGGSDKEKLKLMQKILMSPRGSHQCQVDVCVD